MGQDPTITLSIKEAGERPNSTYLFHIQLDGTILTSNQSLSLSDSQAVREISRTFGALFEQRCRPDMDAEAQKALGKKLFDLWLASSWEKITKAVPVGVLRFLVIASEIPEILNLPWEFLLPPDNDFLGINPLFRMRRFPSSAEQMAAFAGELRPRPLRLLFMACSPTNLATLDYEREEESLFRAIYGQDIAFDSCDLGTFEELKEKVSEFKPHIVHLTGHGAVGKICPECDALNEASGTCCQECSASLNEVEPKGRFAFEKEDGTADLVPSEELRRFLSGSGVQCVFVSGCQSGKAPVQVLNGICQSLVGAEVPLAVGWAASIADDLATNFARTFYRTLKDGLPVDRALLLARQDVQKACRERSDPSWTLPVLYSSTSQSQIFDPSKPPEFLNRQNKILDALPGMKEGYAEHFVGRRREQQRLLPALRSGDLQVVIITGLGGSGKSTLATRLARRLETTNDFIPIPVPSSSENPLNSVRLLQAFGDAFRQFARKERTRNVSKADELGALAMDLNNPQIPVESRLRDAVAALNENHFLLLLDNFESNMDESDLHILDTVISDFYKSLLKSLSGGSRVIITTRYPSSDVSDLPTKVLRENLDDFPESSFIKILQHDPEVERRIRLGELPMYLLTKLHDIFGGTPRFILQIREAIKKMDLKVLEAELANVELPDNASNSELQRIRDAYFQDIITERLYGYLTPGSQMALCRAAIYGIPMTMNGLAAVANEPLEVMSEFVQSWQNRAFAYQQIQETRGDLYNIYGLLRGWLLSKLPQEELKRTHKMAGDFLSEMVHQNRSDDLGLCWVGCLMEARSQYLDAEAYEPARVMTDRLSSIFMVGGHYDEVQQINEEILNRKEHPSTMIWIARAYIEQGMYSSARIFFQRCIDSSTDLNFKEIALAQHGLASIDLRQGEYASAREKFRKILDTVRETGDRSMEASTWHQLGTIDLSQGEYTSAREMFEKAIEIEQQIGDEYGEAFTRHNLASTDLNQGNYDSAREMSEKAMKIEQRIGNKSGEASTWHNLASIDLSQGNYDSARKKYEKSLKIGQQVGDKSGEASTWNALATIDMNQGNNASAREKLEKAMKIRQHIGDKSGEASTWNALATTDMNQGNYDSAREMLEKAMKIRQHIGDKSGEASTWNALATTDMNQGNYDSAREMLEKAMNIEQQIGDKSGEASTWHSLAIIDLKKGDNNSARENFEIALKIRQHIGDKSGEASTWNALATIDMTHGEYAMAREKFEKSMKIEQQIGDRSGEASTWHNLASIDMREGKYDSAHTMFEKALIIMQQIGDKNHEAATWHQLATNDLNQGEYVSARENFEKALKIEQQIGDRSDEASTWHQLATIDLNQGKHELVREKFEKALKIKQEIGDISREAVTWHQLAGIDMKVGDYSSACEKFKVALKISQQVGDKAREAATFHQLGFLVTAQGRPREGLQLVALAYMMFASIGHADTQTCFKALSKMASGLKCTPEQFNVLQKYAEEAYRKDRGQSLIEAAFPKADPDASSHSRNTVET